MADVTAVAVDDPASTGAGTGTAGSEARRARFRTALGSIANSSSDDLVRWMMVPASIAVIAGFNFMLFGWIGASRTFREIEQIPYLISGGLVGLALVFLGGLMLASVFWVVVLRRMQAEAEERTRAHLESLESRLDELSPNGRTPTRRRRPLSADAEEPAPQP